VSPPKKKRTEEEEEEEEKRPPLLTHIHTHTRAQNHGRRIENEENANETPGPTKLEEVEREGEED
jgi:hypothetical protein